MSYMEENDNIGKKIRQLLSAAELQPRLSSFDAVMEKMRKRKRRRFLILFFVGVALFSGSFILFQNRETPAFALSENGNKSSKTQSHAATKPVVDLRKQDKQVGISPEKNENTLSADWQVVSKSNTRPELSAFPALKDPVPVYKAEMSEPGSDSYYTRPDSSLAGTSAETMLTNMEDTIFRNETPCVFLPLVMPLPGATPDTLRTTTRQELIIPKKKKCFELYVGAQFTPYFNRYATTIKPQPSPAFYHTIVQSFSSKGKDPFYFTPAYGLKIGGVFKEKYELFLGAGIQVYHGVEKNIWTAPFSALNNYTSPVSLASALTPNSLAGVPYRCTYYALEGSRIVRINAFWRWKLGAAVRFNRAPENYFSLFPGTNANFYTVDVKLGLIGRLSPRWQFQLNPAVFFGTKSMFSRDYIFKQYPYGFGLEAVLLFKLF